MVKCPKCSVEVVLPDKTLDNHAFHIDVYTCKNCHNHFKVLNS
jgi:hypothetical protein